MGSRRLTIGAIAAVTAALALPVAARADVTVTGFSVTPTTTAAGAHPDVTVHEAFSYSTGSDSVKKTLLHFPPGLLGNPQATALCPVADFQNDSCAANTQVGTTTVTAAIGGLLPAAQQGKIYNLVPDASHPAVLGIVVSTTAGKIFLTSPISLRTATDFGIDSPVDNTPNTAGPLNTPIQITAVDLTLFGNPPGGKGPFMSNPTSCKPATTTLDAVSWDAQDKTAHGTSTFTPTACDQLAFAPKLRASMGAPGATARGSRVPFQATITQAVGEASQLSAAVTLPTSLSSAVNSVSVLCTADQLAAAACPDGARIGTARIASPLLPLPVQGPVFAVLRPAQLPGVGVEFGGTLPFVLGGNAALAPGGRLQNVFNGLPDVPLTSFQLAIAGGPHGLLAAGRDLCSGPVPTVDGAFTGQNGASVTASAPVTVLGCGPAAARKPRGSASLRGLLGRHPLLKLTLRKGSIPLRTVTVTLPKDIKVGNPRRGLRVTGASFRLSKRSVRLSRKGKLTLRLPSRGASRVSVRLGGGSIHASKRLKAKLRKHRSAKLRLIVRTVDKAGHRSTLHVKLTGRR
ncbi:MAG TPA: hypothetical protein VFL87_04465 [Thermoleophilaceae bacterium]|nr:hypothetical protein [Thermoleophilaceae bacterium]